MTSYYLVLFWDNTNIFTIIFSLWIYWNGIFHNITGSGLPSFEWKSINGDIKYLCISFPDGGRNDLAILKPSIPTLLSDAVDDQEQEDTDDCIFHGHLRDEKQVAVYLSGCPGNNTFEV